MEDETVPQTTGEARERIKSWLTEERLLKETVEDERLSFHFACEYPVGSGRHMNVFQPKDHEDLIVIFSRIRLVDLHKNALAAMPQKEKERLIWQMRYDLLFRESSFEMEMKEGELEGFRFTRELYADGLNKNLFMDAIRENFKGELYVIWKFQEVFGEGQAARISGPPEPMYC
ncbi:MAG: hypothetical protein A4E48_01438 [Methanosaeta sp. PtaU1.Bin060]|jgi:hypothetical protein|nr:MAG: hypothetical protein A4E48_01438 [Methanosaeta sp. PtaU1.Bin060]